MLGGGIFKLCFLELSATCLSSIFNQNLVESMNEEPEDEDGLLNTNPETLKTNCVEPVRSFETKH
jgi:hypothetical protein